LRSEYSARDEISTPRGGSAKAPKTTRKEVDRRDVLPDEDHLRERGGKKQFRFICWRIKEGFTLGRRKGRSTMEKGEGGKKTETGSDMGDRVRKRRETHANRHLVFP